MKKDIHPKYYPEAKVICACGNTWTTGSTREEIHTEMCSVCHPFFTGEQRIVDTAGQVDRFQRRKERADKLAEESARRRLGKGKKAESLFEFVTEAPKEKPTAQETLQAQFPEVAEQLAAAETQPTAEAKPKARRAARKPRENKPEAAAKGKGTPTRAPRKRGGQAAAEGPEPTAEATQ